MQRTNFRRWSEENICCGEVCRHARNPAELFGIYEAESVGMDKSALRVFENRRCARAFLSRCLIHRKHELLHHVSGCETSRSRLRC
jgi:hypothetical protein